MKGKIFRKNPLLAIFVVLSLVFSMVAVLTQAEPVDASVSDNLTILSPTTAVPLYAKPGGSVNITCYESCNLTGAVDIDIYVYRPGTTTQVNHNYYGPTLSLGDNSWVYAADIPTGTADGNYDVRVRSRQPQIAGDYVWSATQSNAITVDSILPSAPTLLLPVTGTCATNTTPTFSWTAVTDPSGITYTLMLDGSDNITGILGTSQVSPALNPGSHSWAVKAVDGAGNSSTFTTWSYSVDVGTPTNPILPRVDGSAVNPYPVPGSYNPTLSWTAGSDATPSCGLRYWVQITNDAYAHLAASANTTNISYTPGASLGAGAWDWRVRSVDLAGNVDGAGWVNGNQFIIPAGTTSYDIDLGTGWNLISLPLIPNSNAIATVLSGISANVTGVYYWDACATTPAWKIYIPGVPGSTLQTMEDGKGYWMYMTGPRTLTVTGTQLPVGNQVPPVYNLCVGWNMMGYKSAIPRACIGTAAPTGYLNGIQGKYSTLFGYAGGYFEVDLLNGPLQPGRGYWIYMTQSGSITAPTQ